MHIVGINGLTTAQLRTAIVEGGRFVFFEYCVSFVVFTLRRPSEIRFLHKCQWGWFHGLPYTLLSVLFGWWGLPWGLLYTPIVVLTNLTGGCDVTAQTCAYLGMELSEQPSCDEP